MVGGLRRVETLRLVDNLFLVVVLWSVSFHVSNFSFARTGLFGPGQRFFF